MRVSAERDDPDYVPPPESCEIRVFLDGVEQSPRLTGRGIVMADDRIGEIIFHEMEEGDQPYRPFKTSGNEIAKFTARGNVRIVRPGYIDFASLTRF